MSDNFGADFVRLGGFVSPAAAAIGKGRNGSAAYYVFEAADEGTGLYVSDDSGASWEKITDGSNCFCSISDMDADKTESGTVYIATTNRSVFEIRR